MAGEWRMSGWTGNRIVIVCPRRTHAGPASAAGNLPRESRPWNDKFYLTAER